MWPCRAAPSFLGCSNLSIVSVLSSLSLLPILAAAAPAPRERLEGERTVLLASSAAATGKIRLEGPPTNALGSWTDPSDTITWSLEAPEEGSFDVELTYACAKGSGGSTLEVVGGGARLEAKVHETGDWGSFASVPLGLLRLPRGPSTITVRAAAKPPSAQGILHLRQLVLEKGFKPLFDGKTLQGWQGSTDGYQVENGTLVAVKTGGGNLYTAREYGDFAFRFEFLLERGSNNGLGIRAPLKGDAAYVGMEIQILDDEGYAGKIQPWQRHGSIYAVKPAEPGHLRPVGEWNVEEVTARGRQVTVKLNGATIVDANLDDVKDEKILKEHPGLARASGYIGFLGHGSRVEFRNIRLKELEAKH